MEDKKLNEEVTEEMKETAEAAAEAVTSEIDQTVEIAEAMSEDLSKDSAASDEVRVTAEEIISDVMVSGAGAAEEETELKDKKAAETAQAAAKSAAKEPPIIRKKKKLDKTNIIVIVICAVVVLACLAFVAIKMGWFKGKTGNAMTLGDYSKIEVLKSAVEISDEMIDQYVNNILQSQSSTDQITEGVVEDGDTLNIDYVGKLEETGEVFDGGSATGQSLTIGSGMMIEGFESSLIGAKVGETTTIHVTFPEDYKSTDLAGKPASFDITVNYKSVTKTPELTDDFVKEYSANYLEKELKTVQELKDYVRDYIYNYYLHTAMFEDLQTKQTVTSYDEDLEKMLSDYTMQSLEYYAASYGTTADQYAAMYGVASAADYAKQEADYYLDTIMLIDRIIKDKNITWTEDEFNQSVALYMSRNGYSDMYTVEEFLEQSGETWKYLYENLEFKYDLAMKALEPNVVFVDEKTSTAAESGSEEVPVPETQGAAN